MRIIVFIFVCLGFIVNISCSSDKGASSEQNVENRSIDKNIEIYFNALVSLKKFNGVVLIEKNGELIHHKAYNIKNDTTDSLYVSTSHQFDLRSISKLIAKYILIKMEAEGKLKLSDPINKYLKDFPNSNKITITHLLENQSGLPRELSNESNLNTLDLEPNELIELIKNEPLEFEPGEETRYSNLGYQLVYYIIGALHTQNFAQFVQDSIYQPNKMFNSGAHFYTDSNNLKNFAYYHTLNDNKEITRINHIEESIKKQAKLYSTTEDLRKLLHLFNSEKINTKMSNSKGIIAHSGGSEGIRSHIQLNLNKNYSFIFLANYDGIPFSDIIQTLENIIENKTFKIPKKLNRKKIKLSHDQLIRYEGTYDFEDANHITFEFKVEDGNLNAYQNNELSGTLFIENDSTFFWDPESEESVIFRLSNTDEYSVIMDMFGAPWKGTKIK